MVGEELRGVAYQLVHGTSDHVLGHHDGAGDGEDGTILVFSGLQAHSLLSLRRHSGWSWGLDADVVRKWRGLLDARAVVGGRVGERW